MTEAKPPRCQLDLIERQNRPTSVIQEDLWSLIRDSDDASRAYNIESVYDIRGPLDIPALMAAVDAVVNRHHALRTVLAESPEGVQQMVLPPVSGVLATHDFSARTPDERTALLEEAVTTESARLFSFTDAPPVRFSLYRMAPDEHVLVIVVHHLVFDGWSMGVLLHDLADAYDLARAGRPLPTADGVRQFGDFAEHQRQWLASPEAGRMTDHWVRRLRHTPEGTTVPYDHPAPDGLSFAGDRCDFELPDALARHIREVARSERVTPTAVAMLGYQLLMRELSGQEDVAVGLPLANRGWPGARDCVGLLINTHVLRQRLPTATPTRDLLHTTADLLAGAVQNQAIPLRNVYQELLERYGEEALPRYLYQTLFICHTHPHTDLRLGDATVERRPFDQRASKADMTLNLWVRAEGISGQLEYNTDLYTPRTAARVVRRYEETLTAVVEDLVW
ncbi:condensation domain-containing protein [Streptomyces sp. Ac-502]|uniref:condensation domain-containing protein n=1 Tax=Streptomyces sp. Ac-502 TaxID=3342801 RepID=UPI0038625063